MSVEALPETMRGEQDEAIAAVLERERPRLRGWLRRQLADAEQVEDLLQDVFYELVLAYRLGQPLQHVGAWLFRVARNRLTDLLRRRRPETVAGDAPRDDQAPAAGGGPEADYLRALLVEELAEALDELPAEQREVFLAHEVEGISFTALSALTGVGVNTLLSRKHYAVLRLRRRLQDIHEQIRTEGAKTR